MPGPSRPLPLTDHQRDKMIEEYAPVVRYLAQRLVFRLPPHLDLEDLIQAGIIGLMDAIVKYDASREAQFKTYAEFRIRGAMLDEIRALNWVPRSVREKVVLLQNTIGELEKKLKRHPSEEEMAAALEMSLGEFEAFLSQAKATTLLRLDDLGLKEGEERNLFDSLADAQAEDPLILLLSQDTRETLIAAIRNLPKKEQLVVSLYYENELNMKEIGKVLSVTESRVCQLHTQAILRLKNRLKGART